jgi:hypothetical protein
LINAGAINRIPDATGWISENGPGAAHVITGHAAIASMTILILAALVVQLLPRPPIDPDDHDP